jgi:hypothetical protein
MEVDNRTQSYNNNKKNRKIPRDEDREERIKAYKLKEKDQQRKFQGKTEEELAKAGEQEQEHDLEGLWELWKNTLLTAAKQVCGTSRPGGIKKATLWWTPEIGNMIKEKKRKWKKYLSAGTLETFEENRRQKDIVKKAVQEAKKEM